MGTEQEKSQNKQNIGVDIRQLGGVREKEDSKEGKIHQILKVRKSVGKKLMQKFFVCARITLKQRLTCSLD